MVLPELPQDQSTIPTPALQWIPQDTRQFHEVAHHHFSSFNQFSCSQDTMKNISSDLVPSPHFPWLKQGPLESPANWGDMTGHTTKTSFSEGSTPGRQYAQASSTYSCRAAEVSFKLLSISIWTMQTTGAEEILSQKSTELAWRFKSTALASNSCTSWHNPLQGPGCYQNISLSGWIQTESLFATKFLKKVMSVLLDPHMNMTQSIQWSLTDYRKQNRNTFERGV